MATQESALLGDYAQHPKHVDSISTGSVASDDPSLVSDSEDIYNRFTCQQKHMILTVVSLAGLLLMFIGSSFVPSIPQISEDLKVTPDSASLGISFSVLASSFGVMFWSGYASFYGRRPVYLCGMPFTILGSFAVAVSTNINMLLFWRFVQTFGCSGSLVIGATVVGDIHKLEDRGSAMGTIFGAMFVGLAVGPLVGGGLAQYASWRSFQVFLGAWGTLQMLLLIFFLPETAHPEFLGVNRVRDSRGPLVWINPFRCLALLRSPNIMAVTLANTSAVLSDYTLLIPIAYTIGAKYGIKNEGLIGALFLPVGIGNFLGAPLAGYISDKAVRRAKTERKGVWVPEDRLRALWLGGLVLVPLSVVLVGFTTTYINGVPGLLINLVSLFINGVGVDLVLTPIGTYVVDIVPARGSEAMAAMVALRSILLAAATTVLMPSIQTIGVAATNSIVGLLALLGYFLVWLTIRYGKQMRAYIDVGYPDFEAEATNNEYGTM